MYEVIVVDDEQIIRESLAEIINTDFPDFKVVRTFEDGRDAIKYLNDYNDIALVITDIKMITTSGLEVARYINETNSNIDVVILSGFRDFSYAKEAISQNVIEYLLKPLRYEDLEIVLEKVKTKLDKQIKLSNQMESADKKAFQFNLSIKENFICDLKAGILNNNDILDRYLIFLGFENSGNDYKAAMLTFELENLELFYETRWNYSIDDFNQALINILIYDTETLLVLPFCLESNQVNVLILEKVQSSEFLNNINTYICDVIGQILEILLLKMVHTKKEIFENIGLLVEKYKKSYDDGTRSLSSPFDSQQEKIFISHILNGSELDANFVYQYFLSELKNLDLSDNINIIKNIFEGVIENLGLEYNCADILDVHNITLLKSYGETFIKRAIKEAGIKSSLSVIERLCLYIETNYKKDISLNDLSEYVYLSTVYIRKIFKEKTGMTFVDYLTNVRIQKAIELLSDHKLKVYEIGNMVGYNTTRYFYNVFKKHTGYTPSGYREKLK